MTARPRRTPDRWVADDRIGWRVLLTARAAVALDRAALDGRLQSLHARQGWPDAPPVVEDDDTARLRAALVSAHPAPLRVGLGAPTGTGGRDLVLSAHHGAADGLALLQVLDALGTGPVTSTARGVEDRPTGPGLARTVAGRLAEVAVRPPARVTTPRRGAGGVGDVLVEREVTGRHRTADLVHAAAQGVVAHEAAHGRRARRVAVAVGAGRPARPGVVADRSALIRLRDVERLDRADVARLVRTAPLQVPPTGTAERPWTPYADRAMALGLRLLAPRLGSTVLVSHLGEVTAPAVQHLAFHPVTAGGTGISLGAVGLAARDQTVLTLRARADRWTDDGLEQLLEAVISLL